MDVKWFLIFFKLVVNGHQAITTTASSTVTLTTMSTTVRTSTVQLPTTSTVMASQKPVMRVSPLAADSQGGLLKAYMISLCANPLSWSPGQVKIMKEFVWLKRKKILNLAFGQVGEKNWGKDCITIQYWKYWVPNNILENCCNWSVSYYLFLLPTFVQRF